MPHYYDYSLPRYRSSDGQSRAHIRQGQCGCGGFHGSPLDHGQSFPSLKGVLHLHLMDGSCPLTGPCKATTPTGTEHDVAQRNSIDQRLDLLEIQLEKANREKDFFENVPDEPVVDPDDPCFIFMTYESDSGRTFSWKYAVGKIRGNRTTWSVCGPDSYVIEQDLSWERLVTRHFFAPDHQITISEAVGWEQLFTHPPINEPADAAE